MPQTKPAGSGLNIRALGENVFGSRNTDLAVRVAIFTAAAHCCLGLLFVAGFQVYVILETFVRPLMWALLTGTFLFPFKSFLADLVKSWLQNLRSTRTPILVAVAWSPISLLDRGLDYVGAEVVDFFRQHGRKFLYVVGAIIAYFFLYFWLSPYLGFLGSILKYVLNVTNYLSTHKVWLIIVPYAVLLHLFWSSGYRRHLLYAAIPLWILMGFYASYVLDELAVPVCLFVIVTVALGYSEASTTPVTRPATRRGSTQGHATVYKMVSSTVLPSTRQTISRNNGNLQETISEKLAQNDSDQDLPATPDGEAADADDRPQSSSQQIMNLLGDGYGTMGSLLKQSYKNVADVLTDESLATHTESEKADAEAIRSKLKGLGVGGDAAGTRYITYVFWMFFLLEALTSYYMIPLILLPVTYRVLKTLFRQQRVEAKLTDLLTPLRTQLTAWTDERAEVVTPSIIKSIITYAKVGDRKVLTLIESVTDETVSAILICLMFVFAAITGVIAMLQIEQESSYMVAVSGKMFDETFRNHPEYYEWLPEADELKEHFNTALDSAYVYGRDWSIKTIRSTIADPNETRVDEITHDLTNIADRFYSYYIQKNGTTMTTEIAADPSIGISSLLGGQLGDSLMWLTPNANGTSPLTDLSVSNLWASVNADMLTAVSQYLNLSRIQAFVKEHIETFMSVLESVWSVLKGNLALIMSLVTTISSVTLTYFSAFLNFILCAIVYLTALFYLLSSSGKRYRPIELISAAGQYLSGAETFAGIIEDTISGIFAVSIKIGTFYGFYTWVLLSFCGVYVRFIPSVLAALFAVCPLVPSYVVCLPAALNMWLRGDYITLAILLGGAYLPKLFVDAAIYGDLKTTSPYLFGLAVAGGLVTLGVEGAVTGPLMLCFLVVVMECFKMAIQSRLLDTQPTEEVDDTSNHNGTVKT